MKRYGPWLLVGLVLAILILGLRPDRATRMFLDSPIGRVSCLDLSRLFVPAVKPAKFSLPLEARRSRAGPANVFLCFPTSPSIVRHCARRPYRHALDRSPRAPTIGSKASPLKLQGPPGTRAAPQRGKLPLPTRETRGSRKHRRSATFDTPLPKGRGFLLQPAMLASARLTRSPQAFSVSGIPRRRFLVPRS